MYQSLNNPINKPLVVQKCEFVWLYQGVGEPGQRGTLGRGQPFQFMKYMRGISLAMDEHYKAHIKGLKPAIKV